MVTADTDSYATLAFTGAFIQRVISDSLLNLLSLGVSVYFYSPLWPFRVTTAVSLDGGQPDLVDLRDYEVSFKQDGAEVANSSIVWYTDGLDNTSHLLNVSVGAGEDLAIVDYLVYEFPPFISSPNFTFMSGTPFSNQVTL